MWICGWLARGYVDEMNVAMWMGYFLLCGWGECVYVDGVLVVMWMG